MLPKLRHGDAAGAAPAARACGRRSSCRSAATPACRPCWPPAACGVPIVVVSYDRRPGRASALTARVAAASRRGVPGLAAAARRRHRRPGAAPDPRRRPRRRPCAAAARARPARRPLRRRRHRRLAGLGGAQRRGRRLRRRPRRRPGLAVRQVVGDRFLAAAPAARDGTRRRAAPGRRLRRPHRAASTPPPTCSSGAAGRAPSPRSPSPARRRSSCRGPAPPRTTRRSTCAGCPTRAAAVLLAEPELGRLGELIDELRADPAGSAALGERAAAAGDLHRGGALVERHRASRRGSRRRCARSRRAATLLAWTAPCPPSTPAAAPVAPLDLSRPLRLHVVGVGGPGMSADRHRPGRDGPHRVRAATSATSRCSTGSGRPASTSTSATTAPSSSAATPSRRRRRSPPATSSCGAAREHGHPDAAPGRDAGVDLRPGPLDRRRRHARQDDDDVDADADPRRGRAGAELHRRRRRHRRRHRRPLDRRRVARRRGRRERRHAPRAAAARHDPDQRRARLPRALRLVRGASSTASTATSAQIAGPKVVCADDPLARRPGGPPRRGHLRPRRRRRLPRRRRALRRRLVPLRRRARRGAAARRGRPAAARRAQRRQRHRGDGHGDRASASPFADGAAAPWPASAASPAASTSAASTAGRRSSTTTATCPTEIAAVIAAARDSGDGWGRVVVAFQPNRFNRIAEMWREYADAFVGADVVVLTDIYPSGTTPIPGVTGQADRQRRARRPSPTPASCGCRGATTWCRSSPARSARATCASRWAAATSPRCPRRSSPAGAAAVARADVDEPRPTESARRASSTRGATILGARRQRDVPLAPLTTYRVGGPAALFVRARSLDDLRRVAARPPRLRAARPRRRTRLEPARRRRRLRRHRRVASPTWPARSSCRRTATPGTRRRHGGRRRRPAGARPADRGSRPHAASSGPSACPARSAARCG